MTSSLLSPEAWTPDLGLWPSVRAPTILPSESSSTSAASRSKADGEGTDALPVPGRAPTPAPPITVFVRRTLGEKSADPSSTGP